MPTDYDSNDVETAAHLAADDAAPDDDRPTRAEAEADMRGYREGYYAKTEAPDIRASRIADEIVKRFKAEKSLGTPSLYNIMRETLIDEFTGQL